MHVVLCVVQGRGAPRTLGIDAVDRRAARAEAVRQGYTVLDGPRLVDALPSLRRRSAFDVVIFVEQLRDLLAAGLGVVEALTTLRRGSRGETAAAIATVERRLAEGAPLSAAFEDHTGFPALLVALVRTSELTSELVPALGRFLEHERRIADVRHKVAATAIYPLLLLAVGGAVLAFLLFYVMPRFARVFEGMSGQLPAAAEWIVWWAEVLRDTGPAGIAGLACVVAALSVCLSVGDVRKRLFAAMLDRRPFRSGLKTHFLAHWYRATGLLVAGGIPLASALGTSLDVLPVTLQTGGRAVRSGVEEGLSPAEAYARADMATPVAERLLLAGERTGDLGDVLQRIARFHEAEVARTIERAMRALEPVVMVAIGLGVGFVVVAMYLPIFELASAIR